MYKVCHALRALPYHSCMPPLWKINIIYDANTLVDNKLFGVLQAQVVQAKSRLNWAFLREGISRDAMRGFYRVD